MWINLQPVSKCQTLLSFKSTEILLLISNGTGLKHICTSDRTVFSPWFYFINSNLPISISLMSSLFIQMMTNPKFMLHIKSLANHANIFMKCRTAKEIVNGQEKRKGQIGESLGQGWWLATQCRCQGPASQSVTIQLQIPAYRWVKKKMISWTSARIGSKQTGLERPWDSHYPAAGCEIGIGSCIGSGARDGAATSLALCIPCWTRGSTQSSLPCCKPAHL